MSITTTPDGLRRIFLPGGAITVPREVSAEYVRHLLDTYPAGTPSRRRRIIDGLREEAAAIERDAKESLDAWCEGRDLE